MPGARLEVGLDDAQRARLDELRRAVARLAPLQLRLPTPEPGDWLAVCPEPGQTLEQFLRVRPRGERGARSALCVQPLGPFRPEQRRVVALAARYLELFFALPVRTLREIPLNLIPLEAQRRHPDWGDQQLLTGWILDHLLAPAVPTDAVALICLTAADLWPGEGWNYVFGQANLERRVAVWSIYRNGDPSNGPDAFRVCLRRTLLTAAHELAHLLGLAHEIRFRCLMNGSNHREEADQRPLWPSPETLAKLCWATGDVPAAHCRRVEPFLAGQGFAADLQLYRHSLRLLAGEP
jgi:archaemetzincin